MSDETQPVALTAWQIIGMVFAVITALWLMQQDYRNNLKDYLTIREHGEYATNARADLKRVEEENAKQVSKDTFNSWKDQRTHLTDDIQQRLMERVSRNEMLAHIEKDKDLITNLQRQVDQLRQEMHGYHDRKEIKDMIGGRPP